MASLSRNVVAIARTVVAEVSVAVRIVEIAGIVRVVRVEEYFRPATVEVELLSVPEVVAAEVLASEVATAPIPIEVATAAESTATMTPRPRSKSTTASNCTPKGDEEHANYRFPVPHASPKKAIAVPP